MQRGAHLDVGVGVGTGGIADEHGVALRKVARTHSRRLHLCQHNTEAVSAIYGHSVSKSRASMTLSVLDIRLQRPLCSEGLHALVEQGARHAVYPKHPYTRDEPGWICMQYTPSSRCLDIDTAMHMHHLMTPADICSPRDQRCATRDIGIGGLL